MAVKMQCASCGAIYDKPAGRSFLDINFMYRCTKCGESVFGPAPKANDNAPPIAGAAVGAAIGAAIGGPPGAVVGGLIGFLFGAKAAE